MSKKKQKKPAKKPAAKKKAVKRGPRQKSLPGMEDRKITALDNAALAYDEVKKARMDLTEQEVEAKETVRRLMHEQNKTTYKHNGITIDLVPEGEKVKVHITAAGEDDDEQGESESGEEVAVEVEQEEESEPQPD